MTDPLIRRSTDPLLVALDKKVTVAFQEIKDWRIQHEKECAEKTLMIENMIKPLREVYETVDKPARWVGRIMVLVMTGACLWLGERLAVFFSRHVS